MIWSLRSNSKNRYPFDQQELYFEVQNRLRQSYAGLPAQLAPFWRKAKIKSEVVTKDPFLALIDKQSAKEFVENWEVMRTLPARGRGAE